MSNASTFSKAMLHEGTRKITGVVSKKYDHDESV